ncbi:hypothetical protein RN001_003749 [Aquatica leii]|uniref:BESS domain-containing protein n=1 Tax=Aquatica leii TaxID=1421715 RepID=A0AAN7QP98_9COLE|nr:hypothetical protein RN001_003749 [Aquatica leii]
MTVSSISLPSPSVSSDLESSSTEPAEMQQEDLLSTTTKKRKQDEKQEFHKILLDALENPQPMQGLDGFLIRLGESLKRFPYRERSRLEIEIMQLVFDRDELNIL